LGGIVLPLHKTDRDKETKWAFIFGSVGDCKALLFSHKTGTLKDLTSENRTESSSASDCGGRLGPFLEENAPDLRNLNLYFQTCSENDMIIVVSDGVYDNLDPEQLGKRPCDVQPTIDDSIGWKDLDPVKSSEYRNTYRCWLLLRILRDGVGFDPTIADRLPSGGKIIQPSTIVRHILNYCVDTTEASRTWMEENPTGKLPNDFVKYPGKMDHTTCVAFTVGYIDTHLQQPVSFSTPNSSHSGSSSFSSLSFSSFNSLT
jgi:hypothetical protein